MKWPFLRCCFRPGHFRRKALSVHNTIQCCTEPHYIAPHHTTLHHTTPHYATLHHTTPHYTTLHHTTPHCTKLHHTTPYYTTLHHTTPHRTTLHHTAPHRTSLYCTVLNLYHCIQVYCIALQLIPQQYTALYYPHCNGHIWPNLSI